MPVDLAMFLSHTGSNLFDYSPFVDDRFSFTTEYDEENFIRSYPFSKNHFLIPNVQKKSPYYSKKSSAYEPFPVEAKTKFSDKGYHLSDGGKKKKVSFADDKGFSLVEIREIPGVGKSALNSPADVTNAGKNNVAPPQKCWKVAFEHPPWTDNRLIELLESNKVALESVKVVKKGDNGPKRKVNCYSSKDQKLNCNIEDVIHGTVKVKNLAFEKNIFVRISFDRWLSSTDVKAKFSQPENEKQKHSNYDTFTFSVEIPPSALKYEVIEFCICYVCNSEEYWDNNGGVNYRLITEIVNKSPAPVSRNSNPVTKMSDDKITLSITTDMEKFCEIDSWNCFLLNQPYW